MPLVDPWQWLTSDGELPEEPHSRREALRICRFIEYGGTLHRLFGRETLLQCRARPQGNACLGLMWVTKTENDLIRAFCSACDAEEMVIENWQRTEWAHGIMAPVPM